MKSGFWSFVCAIFVSMPHYVLACPTFVEQMDATTPALFSKEYEKEYVRNDDGTLAIQTKEHAHVPEKTHTS